jgi:hypothetical protein
MPTAVINGTTINTTCTYDASFDRLRRQPDRQPRPQHQLHLLQQAEFDHQGSSTLFFADDVDHQRFKQTAPRGHHALLQRLRGACGAVLLRGLAVDRLSHGRRRHDRDAGAAHDESVSTRYFHTDHLGSIAVITNETGAVVERDSHDAWGKRRFATGADDPTGSITSQTIRGLTGQEELADVGLVHLNGRVYDPWSGV